MDMDIYMYLISDSENSPSKHSLLINMSTFFSFAADLLPCITDCLPVLRN